MAFKVKILKDSISNSGCRLTTVVGTYPRSVHAELETHRAFSRNSASSRAIPIQKMLSAVWNDPMKPVWWGKNQAGMQAKEELTGVRLRLAKFVWFVASRTECLFAWLLYKIGLHKQISNRRLECDGWITTIISATEWDNFFALRCHPDAQPEIRHFAMMLKEAYDLSVPVYRATEYHLPLVDDLDQLLADGFSWPDIVKISVGRCARVSYLTHDGKRDPKADITLYDRLVNSGHMSPTEHVAHPSNGTDFHGNFKGWVQVRKTIPNEADFSKQNTNG